MKQKGYVLIEMLVATVLLSMAGSALCAGLIQGMKADRTIRYSWKMYDPLRSVWMRMDQDLRNTIILRNYSYHGKQDEMSFPVLVAEKDLKGLKHFRLLQIHYFVKNETLIRSEQELSADLVKERPKERPVLKNVKTAKFSYPYLDERDKIEFRNFWLEKPYFGIPRAVKIEVETNMNGVLIAKLMALPQGRWGHDTENENLNEAKDGIDKDEKED